jgi:ceramide glucosyltransferase
MRFSFPAVLNTSLAILTALSFGLTLWRWLVSLRFPLHRRMVVATALPALTLVKPLKGCDPDTKNCLRSWFLQKYPGPVQILLGVADAGDPVCVVARELLAEFPQADARLVICAENLGANAKVSTLRQLEPLIRHPLIMISDADVRVAPDFAANIAPMLEQPATGLVNCFYRLANPSTAAMRWEAVSINADFWTQVLQSRALWPVDFALGAVMALPAAQLKAIGGFAAISDYLADDNRLGRLVAGQHKRIEFASVVADCWEAPMNWKQVWTHQCRWARTLRVCQPFPFFMSILNNSSLWPLLWLAASRQPLTLGLCGGCLVARIATAWHQQSRLMQSAPGAACFWMPPVKDILDTFVWAAAFCGNRILWRGERYQILPGGKLQRN